MRAPIVERILARPGLITDVASPPMTPAQLAATEAALGFALPGTLRDVYLHVANGGIGPHFSGFMGGVGGHVGTSRTATAPTSSTTITCFGPSRTASPGRKNS